MTIQLSFEYDAAANCELATYEGFTVRAERDSDASNPMDDDGNWPMLAKHERSIKEYDSTKGASIRNVLDRFTDGQILHHQKAIIAAFGNDARYYNPLTGDYSATVADDFAEHVRNYRDEWASIADLKRDYFEDALAAVADCDLFDVLESLYDILKIPCLNSCTQGHSQGDYADVLIVATPESVAEFGLNGRKSHNFERDMKGQLATYGAWACGDCYGYVIGNDDDDHLESCWGYYGSDHDKSGLGQAAAESLKYIIDDRRKARQSRVAEMIANRVPLHIRQVELAQAVQS